MTTKPSQTTSLSGKASPFAVVFLDAGQTILDVRLGRSSRFLLCATAWGLAVEAQVAGEAHQRLWQQHFGNRYPEGDQATTDRLCLAFYQDLLAELGTADDHGAIAARLVDACDFRRWLAPYADTAASLAALQSRARLALLSNAPPSLRQVLEEVGLSGYFEQMIISGEVGTSKPDPAIYALALQSMGVTPGDSLFVDDLEENLAAAQTAGLNCLLMDRRQVHQSSPFPRVTSMEEVVETLGWSRRGP